MSNMLIFLTHFNGSVKLYISIISKTWSFAFVLLNNDTPLLIYMAQIMILRYFTIKLVNLLNILIIIPPYCNYINEWKWKWAVMYMCVRCVDFDFYYDFSILVWNCSDYCAFYQFNYTYIYINKVVIFTFSDKIYYSQVIKWKTK
jgi:hypothetical protein